MATVKVIKSAVGSPAAGDMIKEFKKVGLYVIGIDADRLSAGFFLSNSSYVVPKGNSPNFFKEFLQIVKKERPQGFLSGPEEELASLSKHKEDLEKEGIVGFIPPRDVTDIFTNKRKMYDFFNRTGTPTPKEFTLNQVEFPAVIKPVKGRGGKGVQIVENYDELKFFVRDPSEIIIQEKMNGVEYTIDCFNDTEGNNLAIIPRIRLGVESGISIKGVTVEDREAVETVKGILDNVKIPGPFFVQGFRTEKGFFVTELNLRFGGGSVLSFKACPEILENLKKILEGKRANKCRKYEVGLTMLRFYDNITTKIKKYKTKRGFV